MPYLLIDSDLAPRGCRPSRLSRAHLNELGPKLNVFFHCSSVLCFPRPYLDCSFFDLGPTEYTMPSLFFVLCVLVDMHGKCPRCPLRSMYTMFGSIERASLSKVLPGRGSESDRLTHKCTALFTRRTCTLYSAAKRSQSGRDRKKLVPLVAKSCYIWQCAPSRWEKESELRLPSRSIVHCALRVQHLTGPKHKVKDPVGCSICCTLVPLNSLSAERERK